ncbi:ABC transporter substrate-binding protein [Roseibium aquae]|uniref:ABC transporter substrate-binding protein n=1 Tax=Roseibium aquae TaxID=1323746 RepID=A0A916TEH4_9HYPH|nr:ABC transporter substrate-binding protein [Roseibium aquae]GGB40975.1 ABC transporter substrate-binding protein [Roseibium aquae]
MGFGARAVAAIVFLALAGSAARGETLKFAYQGGLGGLDPYSLNETFTLTMLGNVYEGLTRLGPDMEIEPALAHRWEILEPTRWRFHLRQDVKFHNGNSFTADDVAFSFQRVTSAGSDLRTRIQPGLKIEIVDRHTVDFVLPTPNAILHYGWDSWYIMDKEWTEAHEAVPVNTAANSNQNHAAHHANGTGPFRITTHQTDLKTVFEPFEGWWDEARHNLTRAEFTPVASDATRVAALLSGALDVAYPIPVQDMQRVEANARTRILTAPSLRTLFLGMDQRREELLYSNVRGKNPFKDVRVRKAFYQAINIEAIREKIMRGLSTPASLLISPYLYPGAASFERYPYDPEAARALLAEAGYADGLSVTLDCPNDRYINDEAICQAVAGFLAQIGVTVNLNILPKAQFFSKVMPTGGYDTSFYLLGWIPASLESWSLLDNLFRCRSDDGSGGVFNLGGYCNPVLDALIDQILVATDLVERERLINQAYTIATADIAYLPLHQQSIAWGAADKVEVNVRPDNQFMLRLVRKRPD